MAIAWFICPYKRRGTAIARYCAMNDFKAQFDAEGGLWQEREILGNRAVVKVRCSASLITTLNAEPTFKRLPGNQLNDPLSSLTNQQKTALRNELLDQGYTNAEITGRFGSDLGAFTLGDVLRFMATRRKKARYDQPTDAIILDGVDVPCEPIDSLDAGVQ